MYGWFVYNALGQLTEHGDDSTQTVTEYDPATGAVLSSTPYSADQIAVAQAQAQARAQVTDPAAQLAALQAYVFQATPVGKTAPAWASTITYPPGAAVTYNGTVYVNNSGAWLNGFYVPGDAVHPFWSAQPASAPIPWSVGMPLVPGEFVSNGGHVYQYALNQPATASAPANWAPTGTISTAAWTFTS